MSLARERRLHEFRRFTTTGFCLLLLDFPIPVYLPARFVVSSIVKKFAVVTETAVPC